jgi:hypothetical protein
VQSKTGAQVLFHFKVTNNKDDKIWKCCKKVKLDSVAMTTDGRQIGRVVPCYIAKDSLLFRLFRQKTNKIRAEQEA